jgi:hypothetical protein
MVTCLVVGLKWSAQKVVNVDKLREIQQEKEKNPTRKRGKSSYFLSWLTEVRCSTIQKLTLKLRMGQLSL